MAPMYYRNANAALIVFDITQYDTFQAVKDWVKGMSLTEWLVVSEVNVGQFKSHVTHREHFMRLLI